MPIIEGTPVLVCPECGNDDEFQVMAVIPAQISCKAGGVVHVFEDQGIGVTPNTTCICAKCERAGIVAEFAGVVQPVGSDGSFVVFGQEGNA